MHCLLAECLISNASRVHQAGDRYPQTRKQKKQGDGGNATERQVYGSETVALTVQRAVLHRFGYVMRPDLVAIFQVCNRS